MQFPETLAPSERVTEPGAGRVALSSQSPAEKGITAAASQSLLAAVLAN